MGETQDLRARHAGVSNASDSIELLLRSLVFEGDLDGMRPRSNPMPYFYCNEWRRFLKARLVSSVPET
jgi:hypothetical protein